MALTNDLAKSSLLQDSVIAIALGIAMSVIVFPLQFVVAVFFASYLSATIRARLRAGRRRLATLGAAGSILMFLVIVTSAAAYRPAKAMEAKLNLRLTVPSENMTLARLAYHAEFDRKGFPIRVSFSFAEESKNNFVRFPGIEMTVRQFICAIESQTELRHRFTHCGNSYTVLYGLGPSSYLSVRDPELADSPRNTQLFDVDAFAALHDAN